MCVRECGRALISCDSAGILGYVSRGCVIVGLFFLTDRKNVLFANEVWSVLVAQRYNHVRF
jgi:hypothetical protein